MEINPDIILLSGGTDGGDESCVMENAEMICELHTNATVIIACNKYAQRAVAAKLGQAGVNYVRVPNIMPTIHELNVKPAREAIHEQFIKQITRAKGLLDFRDTLADQTVVPTPGAVLLASELLAKGTYEEEGIGSLILVDIGGAKDVTAVATHGLLSGPAVERIEGSVIEELVFLDTMPLPEAAKQSKKIKQISASDLFA